MRYNVITCEGWHDDGPRGECRDMGGTDEAAGLPRLIARAEEALAANGWPGRVWVTDGLGELIPRRDVLALVA